MQFHMSCLSKSIGIISLRARHPRVADLYQRGVWGVRPLFKWSGNGWKSARPGGKPKEPICCGTNLTDESAEGLWNKYIQLTEAPGSGPKSGADIDDVFQMVL